MSTTLDLFLSLLAARFVQYAFVMGVIIGILSSILSIFIVLKRLSLIGDGLSHTAFGGLSLGYFLSVVYFVDIAPIWAGTVVVVLGSIGITKAIRSTKISGDAAVALFLQLGLASGIMLLSISRGFGFNVETLLFGDILLVNLDQIYVALGVLAATLALIFIFYKELVYTTFDEIQARASGIRTWVFDYMISIVAGIAVIASIPIVGVLVISALLVLPALTSIQIARSFKQTVILSPIFGLISVVLGLLLSLIINSAAGATIVVVGLLIFAIVLGLSKFNRATISRGNRMVVR
jgi:zinc transport system permease protein